MEEALQIFDYLPRSFKTEKEQEYIGFLWDTFQVNYEGGKYQFAFLAYHMLYMCFVYFIIWQIKNNQPDDFSKALVGFSRLLIKKLNWFVQMRTGLLRRPYRRHIQIPVGGLSVGKGMTENVRSKNEPG